MLLRSRLECRGDASLGASLERICGNKYNLLDYKWNRERTCIQPRVDGPPPIPITNRRWKNCRPSIVNTFRTVTNHGRCGIQGILQASPDFERPTRCLLSTRALFRSRKGRASSIHERNCYDGFRETGAARVKTITHTYSLQLPQPPGSGKRTSPLHFRKLETCYCTPLCSFVGRGLAEA